MTILKGNTVLSIKKIMLVSVLGAMFNPLLSANAREIVGSDGGSISVGNSGQAAWTMPVEVPSGINGVAPNLTLSVSTAGGNGSLGVGGGLSGLSAITRCGRTHHQDGYVQAPQYKQEDAYCLDGARLLKMNSADTYGAAGSIYRTEIESFQRIKMIGSQNGNGPRSFEVTNRAGATMVYGLDGARKTYDVDPATGAIAVWKIDQLIDSNSNTLSYQYEDLSTNEVQLTRITYGVNTSENVGEHLSVELVYENRPDTSVGWSRGEQHRQTKRISNIQTFVGSTKVRDYKLNYSQGEETNASRLSSLQECAGNGDCYRPSRFHYAPETELAWEPAPVSIPSRLQTSEGKPLGTIADINNDGKSDWIIANIDDGGTPTIQTYLGPLNGWQPSSKFALPGPLFDYSLNEDGFSKGLLLDVNSDGWADYVQAYTTPTETVIQTWRNTGASFVRDESLDLPMALYVLDSDGKVTVQADVADLNADGLLDLVQAFVTQGGIEHQTLIHTVSAGVHTWAINHDYKTPTIATDYTQGSEGRVLANLMDVNADGLSDWVASYQVGGAVTNKTWLNTGRGWQASSQYALPVALINYDLNDDGIAEYSLTDINGDGLPDLLKAYYWNDTAHRDALIHTGLGWVRDARYNLPGSLFWVNAAGKISNVGALTDLDNDGHPDLVISYLSSTGNEANRQWLFDTNNMSWKNNQPYATPFALNQILPGGESITVAEIADLDGDGYPELFNSITGSLYFASSAGNQHYAGTLIGTTNSLGAETQLTYGITTDPNLYELAEQTPYPNIAYNAPARVVKSVSASNGVGGMISAHHTYGKAKANVLGHGGLGYERHTLVDGNSGVELVTRFHQTYPYAGKVKSTAKRINGKLLSLSNSTMAMVPITIGDLTTLYPHPNRSVSNAYDLKGGLLKSSESRTEIDEFGNTTLSIEEIFDTTTTKTDAFISHALPNAPGASVVASKLLKRSTKQVKFKAADLDRWLFGLPEHNTVKLESFSDDGDETYVNVSTAEFLDDGKPVRETLEPGNAQQVVKTYTYDGFGNRTSSSVLAADADNVVKTTTTRTRYTNNGRFPREVENAAGHKITTEFDQALSKPLLVTDPNGISKEFLYDGFGTIVRETKKHQSDGATRGRQIVLPKWCDASSKCPTNLHAVYFIAAFDDEGEAPEIAYYNVNGKEVRKQTYGHDGKLIVVETQYDENGKVKSFTQPYFQGEKNHRTTYEYDELGREVKRTNASGDVFETRYDGLTITTVNPGNTTSGVQTAIVKNNIFGQPVSSRDPDGNATTFEYDGRGKLVKTIDAKGNEATITYDPVFGRKMAMNDPDLGVWSYTYNALGNMDTQTDAKGQTTKMVYDDFGRLKERIDLYGTPQAQSTKWTFTDTVTQAGELLGGLKRVESPNFARELKYDEFGRVSQANTVIDGTSFQQKTGYSGTADKVDWIQYPTGLTVRNTYDEYGFPKTVEGISLNYSKYTSFQKASKELNDLRRDLESWKDQYLTDAQLAQLEEHERQVRRMGKQLSEFYDKFGDPSTQVAKDKTSYQDVAQRYIDLVNRVQKKLTQHQNWLKHYQAEYDRIYNASMQADIKRVEVLENLIYPQQRAFNTARGLHDNYAAKAKRFADKLNAEGKIINRNARVVRDNKIHVDNLIRSLYKEPNASRYVNNIEAMFYDLECCNHFVVTTFMKTQNPDLIASHLNQIENYLKKIAAAATLIEAAEKRIKAGNWQWWYDHWEPRRKGEEKKMLKAKGYLDRYTAEINGIAKRIQPGLDRVQLWLSPLIKSHNNVILSYNDRARAYISRISQQTGSYVKRDELKAEKFLKPFKNHLDYIQCLKTASNASGTCYKNNLVHVYDGNGNVDTKKQAAARAKISTREYVNVKSLWSTNRFYCSANYGYYCPGFFRTDIQGVAKAIHVAQCARMTSKEKSDSSLTCDTTKWNETYKHSNGNTYPKYPYLIAKIHPIKNTTTFYNSLVSRHKAKVQTLVHNATRGTYNEESSYLSIVSGTINSVAEGLGGALNGGQAEEKPQSRERVCTAWAPRAGATGPTGIESQPVCTSWKNKVADNSTDSDSDPNSFVLIYKGAVQNLVYRSMTQEQRIANRDLKSHQQAIQSLLNSAQNGAYLAKYLAVQNKAAEVTRLYNEIDQAYANAQYLDDYDSQKKVYWQAEDINSKGQIKKAKYGNGVSTEYTYDQFGRITRVFTKNAQESVLNKTYAYDRLGNLTNRHDHIEDVLENFDYDVMNRLTEVKYSGTGANYVKSVSQDTVNYNYDELGNLIYKSDIMSSGQYGYGEKTSNQHAGPHAVTSIPGMGLFEYDANGNQISGNDRTIQYSAFNKPTRIVKSGRTTDMWYGPERQMFKQLEQTDQGLESTLYVGGLFEQIKRPGGGTINRHHISVAGNAIAVVDTSPGSLAVKKESYLHKNHQSSVLAITDASGQLTERRYYDAFGDIKSYIGKNGKYLASVLAYTAATDMSFTGHRWLTTAAVIHMKGRVYDPKIGRFLSADPHIQSPLNTQSLNRYSYVLNNPLSLTDPSGYFFSKIFKKLKKLFAKIGQIIKGVLKAIVKVVKSIGKVLKKIGQFVKKYYKVIIAVIVTVVIAIYLGPVAAKAFGNFAGGVITGAVAGGASGLIATGSLKGMLEGAFFGAVTAGFAYGIQGSAANQIKNLGTGVLKNSAQQALVRGIEFSAKVKLVIGHAVIGGIRSVVNGGKFLTGALTGGVSKAFTFATSMIDNRVFRGLAVAAVGGGISVLAGGSFELGFVTAGLAFAVNEVATSLHKYATNKLHTKLRQRVAAEARDPNAVINLSSKDLNVIANQEYYEAIANRDGGISYEDHMGNADTFLLGYANRSFSIGNSSTTYLGGNINYIGVGASNAAYGVPILAAGIVNAAETIAWNVGQFMGWIETGGGGKGQWQNIENIDPNLFWMNFGYAGANTPVGSG